MRKVTVGAVQMRCSKEPEENICRAEELVREAAGQGAQVILLPELLSGPISARSGGTNITGLQNRRKKMTRCGIFPLWQKSWAR